MLFTWFSGNKKTVTNKVFDMILIKEALIEGVQIFIIQSYALPEKIYCC
jgi:hypothetical protein